MQPKTRKLPRAFSSVAFHSWAGLSLRFLIGISVRRSSLNFSHLRPTLLCSLITAKLTASSSEQGSEREAMSLPDLVVEHLKKRLQ